MKLYELLFKDFEKSVEKVIENFNERDTWRIAFEKTVFDSLSKIYVRLDKIENQKNGVKDIKPKEKVRVLKNVVSFDDVKNNKTHGTLGNKQNKKNDVFYYRNGAEGFAPYISATGASKVLGLSKSTIDNAYYRGLLNGFIAPNRRIMLLLADVMRVKNNDDELRRVFPGVWLQRHRKEYYATHEVARRFGLGTIAADRIKRYLPNAPEPIKLTGTMIVWNKADFDRAWKQMKGGKGDE